MTQTVLISLCLIILIGMCLRSFLSHYYSIDNRTEEEIIADYEKRMNEFDNRMKGRK